MTDQSIVLCIIAGTLFLFCLGKIRHDAVALLSLMTLVITGIIKPETAFMGFADPAIISVAAVLVIGKGLENAGLVDLLIKLLKGTKKSVTLQILSLCVIVALISGFMNNVGALALIMPVAIRLAYENKKPISLYLMPVACSSILGGLYTLIGTPGNLIISSYRKSVVGKNFGMFEFLPFGGTVLVIAVLFVGLIGFRLLPRRRKDYDDQFQFRVDDYVTKLVIKEDSELIGKPIGQLRERFDQSEVVAIIRDKKSLPPTEYLILRANDTLAIQTNSEELEKMMIDFHLSPLNTEESFLEMIDDDEMKISEVIVSPKSSLKGKIINLSSLHWLYKINVLGVSRNEKNILDFKNMRKFSIGDILFLYGPKMKLKEACDNLSLLPLNLKDVSSKFEFKNLVLSCLFFIAAVSSIIMEVFPLQVALTMCALLFIIFKIITIDEGYKSIDWGVIVLLGALMPLGEALESTGGAKTIANTFVSLASGQAEWLSFIFLMIGTMLLSNIINNAATALMMAPIAFMIAKDVGADTDVFLIGTAIASSCAFLTPIGHQSNTLVWIPGGYKFSDYFKMGLPVSIIVILTSLVLFLYSK